MPTLVARAEALEKRARAAAKVAAQLSNIVPDDSGHYGRSRRQRTQVDESALGTWAIAISTPKHICIAVIHDRAGEFCAVDL